MKRYCSFCDHSEDVVDKLIMKNDIGICDRCIKLCNLVLAEPQVKGTIEYNSWFYAAGVSVSKEKT